MNDDYEGRINDWYAYIHTDLRIEISTSLGNAAALVVGTGWRHSFPIILLHTTVSLLTLTGNLCSHHAANCLFTPLYSARKERT